MTASLNQQMIRLGFALSFEPASKLHFQEDAASAKDAVTVIGMSQFGGFMIAAAATQVGAPAAVALGALIVAAGTTLLYAGQASLRRYGVAPPRAGVTVTE